MKIMNSGIAGTMESSDILVEVGPNPENAVTVNLVSSVEKQFGEQIRKVILDTLVSLNVGSAIIKVNDKGALDCVVRARVQTAVMRAAGETNFNWGGEKSVQA